ncbi:MAG: M48 family metallopeptidase [Chloroflexi bacterium]|jgi:STE24 endopeptidase|nr:M48 family metallopeptidase [Chloroflexota bacterium]
MESTQLNPTPDPARQERAKQYARISRRMMLFELFFGFAYLLLWLTSGLALSARGAILEVTPNPWLQVALYAALFGGLYFVINLPLDYYDSFVLPHRFDQSTQSLRQWLADQARSLLVGIPIALVLLEVVYAILRAAPTTWWLWVGLVLLVFNVLAANLAPVLIAPLFYRFEPLQETHPDLSERLSGLAARSHTRIRGVFKIDMSRRTKAANAALMGLGSSRRMVIGDTLINEFSGDEIETVMAHELGHQVHSDIPLGIVVSTLVTLVGLFLADRVLQLGLAGLGLSSPADVGAMPLLALAISVYGLLTSPLENAFSRWREVRADQYALQLTGKGRAYASALVRLADQNLAEADPERWVEWLLYSHPPLSKRIAMAVAADAPAPGSHGEA